jgi:hypothetical protein
MEQGNLNTERKNFSSRILYPAKISFKIDGGTEVFHDKEKLRQYMTTKPPLQKILKGILHTEDENKHITKGLEILNLKRRTDNHSERLSLNWLHTLNFLSNKNN